LSVGDTEVHRLDSKE